MTELSTEKKKRFFVLKRVDSVSPPKEKVNNIFSGKMFINLRRTITISEWYQLFNVFISVPSIENIQQRQIVGKLESFLKSQEQTEHTVKQNTYQASFNGVKPFSKRISMRTNSQMSLFSYQNPHQSQESKQKKQKNFDVISQPQLLKLIQETEERIQVNKEIEGQFEKGCSVNHLVRQTRALNKFAQQQHIWEQQIEEATRKAKRTDTDSVLRKSTCIQYVQIEFREKIEQLEHCEAVKQLEGSNRGNEWYMTLREVLNNTQQSSHKKNNLFRKSVYQDHLNQNTYYVDKSSKPIEIIRNTSQSNSVSKTGLRRNSSLSQINIFKLPLHKTVQSVCEDISNLQVEGVNVLQKEIEQVKFCNSQDKYRIYRMEKEVDECDL